MGYPKHGSRGAGIRPVELSADDEFQFDRLANSLLDDALFEHDQFVTVDRRRVNLAQWKHWKQDDDVVVYRERHPSDPANESLLDATYGEGDRQTAAGQPQSQARFTAFSTHGPGNPRAKSKSQKMPRLLAIGSLSTTLDDVLYGIVTPTGSAMRLKASYLETDDFLDGTVLAQIRAPTSSEPFQFLGIKWMLQKGMGGGLGIVRPRDFVYLESSGVRLRQDGSGQRVGFHIMHSVDLPQCSPDNNGKSSVQRGAFSTCYLYHEYDSGSVDVYMTAMVQPRGNIIAPIALRSAAAMLRSNWRLLSLCAENKKLTWLLETHRQLMPVAGTTAGSKAAASRCGLCSKSFKGFTTKKKLSCQLCSMTVCVHCSMSRTLRSQGLARTSSVASEKMLFCKKCIAMAGEESSSEIARQQLWEDEVVRTGRAHTQTALALVRRETSNGSRLHRDFTDSAPGTDAFSMMAYRPEPPQNNHPGHDLRRTWHDSDPGRRYHIYEQPGSAPNARAVSPGRASLQHPQKVSSNPTSSARRGTNGTWNGSMRATETMSLGMMDYDRTSSYQEPNQTFDSPTNDDAGRASTTSSALVLLDNRKSTRQMKALDYLPPTEAEAALATLSRPSDRMSLASSAMFTEADEVEVESVYSRSSYSSSIAVLDLDASHAAQPLSKAATIVEEEDPSHTHGQQQQQQQQQQYAQAYQEQYQPRQPSFQAQRMSSRQQQPYDEQYQQHRYTQPPPHQRQPSPLKQQQSMQAQDQSHRSSRVQFQEPGSHMPSRDSILRNPRASELLRRSTSAMAGSEAGGRRSTVTNEGSEAGASSTSDQRLSYQMQLWLQMNELRDTAESTYRITQRNAQALASQNPQIGRSMRFFSQQPMGGPPSSRPAAMSMSRAQPPANNTSFVPASLGYPRRYTNAGTPTNR